MDTVVDTRAHGKIRLAGGLTRGRKTGSDKLVIMAPVKTGAFKQAAHY